MLIKFISLFILSTHAFSAQIEIPINRDTVLCDLSGYYRGDCRIKFQGKFFSNDTKDFSGLELLEIAQHNGGKLLAEVKTTQVKEYERDQCDPINEICGPTLCYEVLMNHTTLEFPDYHLAQKFTYKIYHSSKEIPCR